jgi:hypothetical protein
MFESNWEYVTTMVMSTMNTNTPNKFTMNYNPYISHRSNSRKILQKNGTLMKDYIERCWIEMPY